MSMSPFKDSSSSSSQTRPRSKGQASNSSSQTNISVHHHHHIYGHNPSSHSLSDGTNSNINKSRPGSSSSSGSSMSESLQGPGSGMAIDSILPPLSMGGLSHQGTNGNFDSGARAYLGSSSQQRPMTEGSHNTSVPGGNQQNLGGSAPLQALQTRPMSQQNQSNQNLTLNNFNFPQFQEFPPPSNGGSLPPHFAGNAGYSDEEPGVPAIVTEQHHQHLDQIMNSDFEEEDIHRGKLLQENLALKARLRNVLAFLDLTGTSPALKQARKLLPALEAASPSFPVVDYEELLNSQVKRNGEIADLVKKKLIYYYQPTLDAISQKALQNDLRQEYKIDVEEHTITKELQTLNKWGSSLQFQVDRFRTQINSKIGETGSLVNAKQYLEIELLEQKNLASQFKSSTESLKEEFLLVNATVSKYLKTVNKISPFLNNGAKQERTIQSMKTTLCRLAKESARLQVQLESTLKDEKLSEVKYKARNFEAMRTWKSGLCNQNQQNQDAIDMDEDNGDDKAETKRLYEALESAETQAKTGVPLATHHSPVWMLSQKPVVLASEPHTHQNAKARQFLTEILHKLQGAGTQSQSSSSDNKSQTTVAETDTVEIFNKLYENEKADERYRAIKLLACEFCVHYSKGSRMTQLMKDLQQMNNFRDMEMALKSISAVICRVLECDFARCWYINQSSKTAWVCVQSKKTESKIVSKDLSKDPNCYVSRAFHSQQPINVADAYSDPNFNREMDRISGFRTKAVLCAPIRTQGKVRAVIEAVNKISTSSSVFDTFDEFLLHVVGYSTVDVVNKCQKHRANLQGSQRKDILLEAAEECFQKCHAFRDLYRVLSDRMFQLFRATDVRVVLVHAAPPVASNSTVGPGSQNRVSLAPGSVGGPNSNAGPGAAVTLSVNNQQAVRASESKSQDSSTGTGTQSQAPVVSGPLPYGPVTQSNKNNQKLDSDSVNQTEQQSDQRGGGSGSRLSSNTNSKESSSLSVQLGQGKKAAKDKKLLQQEDPDQPAFLQRVDIDLDGGLLTREFGIVGLTGECVQAKKMLCVDKPRKTMGRRFHHGVDSDSDGRCYFWPMLYRDKVSVVMQFSINHPGVIQDTDGQLQGQVTVGTGAGEINNTNGNSNNNNNNATGTTDVTNGGQGNAGPSGTVDASNTSTQNGQTNGSSGSAVASSSSTNGNGQNVSYDDSSDTIFDANNSVHVQALEKLFAMCMFFVEKWWPSNMRLFPSKTEGASSKRFQHYVEFKKLMQPNNWKEETESYAALIIQRWARRNKLKRAIFGLSRARLQAARLIQAYWCSRISLALGHRYYREGRRTDHTHYYNALRKIIKEKEHDNMVRMSRNNNNYYNTSGNSNSNSNSNPNTTTTNTGTTGTGGGQDQAPGYVDLSGPEGPTKKKRI